jgi:porphyrinogen peroxidase
LPEPQSVILPEPSENAIFMIMRVRDAAGSALPVAKIVARTPALAARLAALDRRAKLVSAVGIGSDFWDVLSPGRRPAGLRPFKSMTANSRSAPSTGGDLLFHIVSKRHDLNFELALKLRDELGEMVEVMDEVHGFRYLDSRDLTGFIDGTENPKGKERAEVALVGEEDREFAGGSYVFTQRYVHDLKKWSALSSKDQERAVGRRKRDSQELSAKAKPPTAHISRVTIEEDGKELKIVRHSFPYGTVSEAGLFFIAYCRTLDIPQRMLERMIGAGGDSLHDHLMDFTRAISGATFFAPSLRTLGSLAGRSSRRP